MESADIIAEIPTYGVKNSLNVASAAPIVVFEVLRQWSKKKLI
jgi:tRNA G18 (ribose-2'-O)-methylase SpoU